MRRLFLDLLDIDHVHRLVVVVLFLSTRFMLIQLRLGATGMELGARDEGSFMQSAGRLKLQLRYLRAAVYYTVELLLRHLFLGYC